MTFDAIAATTTAAHNPAAANGLSAYEIEQRRLGRSIMGRIDFIQQILCYTGASGGGTLTNAIEGKPPVAYSGADALRAKETVPGQIYTMLLAYKADAETGSLRMAAIDEWIGKLKGQYPLWSGKPSPIDENAPQTKAHFVMKHGDGQGGAYDKPSPQAVAAQDDKAPLASPQFKASYQAIAAFLSKNKGDAQSWTWPLQHALARYENMAAYL